MKNGKINPNHPCKDNPHPLVWEDDDTVPITNDPLGKFRQLGYYASCFPEGDGISMNNYGKSYDRVVSDIKKCFPDFEVVCTFKIRK